MRLVSTSLRKRHILSIAEDPTLGPLTDGLPGMERLSLDLARFPDEEIALDVCGDAGAGRLYGDEDVKEWYLCLPSGSLHRMCQQC